MKEGLTIKRKKQRNNDLLERWRNINRGCKSSPRDDNDDVLWFGGELERELCLSCPLCHHKVNVGLARSEGPLPEQHLVKNDAT